MAIIDAMDGVAHVVTEVNAGSLIAWAVNGLPSTGGIVDARRISPAALVPDPPNDPLPLPLFIKQTIVIDKPVTLWLGPASLVCQDDANPAFEVRDSFRVVGLNRQSTAITSLSGGTIFLIPSNFNAQGAGRDEFSVESMELVGVGDGSAMLVTTGSPFNDGLIRIENCNLHNFGGVAIQIGEMNKHVKLRNNYFIFNRGSLFLDRQAEAVIEANEFYSANEPEPPPPPAPQPTYKPQVEVVGPNVRIVGNVFIRATHSVSSEPDIQIRPKNHHRDGGYVWIVDNRMTNEGENMDPQRCRIRVRNPDAGGDQIVSPRTIVRGNLIAGVGSAQIASIQRTNGAVTVVLYVKEGVPRLPPGAEIAIAIDSEASFNGVFPITSNTGYTITYDQPALPDVDPITFADNARAYLTPVRSTAIRLDNPIEGWHISENIFHRFGTVIDDSAQPAAPTYPFGLSTFKDNTIVPPWSISTREFSGGGKQFSSVQVPVGSALEPWSGVPRDGETLTLQNYLRSSEDLSATPWNAVMATVTGSQADPYGTSRAFRIVRFGTVNSERIQQDIALPSGWTLGSQMVVKFWAKAGTMASAPAIVDAAIRDLNVPAFVGGLHTFSLTSAWKQYKFVVRGIDKTHLYRLIFYPAGTWAAPGDVYLFAPQVAEVDCDYLPTTTASPDPSKTVPHALEDADAGNRFHKAVILTRMKTTSRAPGTGPSLSGESGLGTDEARAATLEAGSTDMAGVIQLKAGGAGGGLTAPGSNGQIHVAFSAPYRTSSKPLFTGRAPIVLASLVDGTSAWSAAAQVKVLSDASASGFTLKWDNGAALTPSGTTASTYKISYMVVGR